MLELAFAEFTGSKGTLIPTERSRRINRRSATLIMHERSPVPRRGQDQRQLTIGRELALCKNGRSVAPTDNKT